MPFYLKCLAGPSSLLELVVERKYKKAEDLEDATGSFVL